MKHRLLSIAVLGTLLTVTLFSLQVPGHAQEPIEDIILHMVASDQGMPKGNLEIGDLVHREFPLSGISLYEAKVIDTSTGEIYSLAVDEDGSAMSLEDALTMEEQAHRARYGHLDPDLFDLLETTDDNETQIVGIWLKAEGLTPLERMDIGHQPSWGEAGDAELPQMEPRTAETVGDLEEDTEEDGKALLAKRVEEIRADQADQRAALDAFDDANMDHLADQISTLQAPLLKELRAQGHEPIYISPIAPLIYVELTKSSILSLANGEDIDTIYGPNEYHDLMDIAKDTQKADIVDAFGFDGTGVDVAILEDSRVQFNNPYLNAGTTRVIGSTNVDDHATATAGMVASQHSTYQGIAQGATIFSANATTYSDANLSAAMDWAVSQGVDIINNSWGGNDGTTTLNVHDRHLDYIVRMNAKTVTVSAGNEGTGSGRVSSPARGYNVISVGNYQDMGTLTWVGDAIASSSSYIDPSTGVEKPELAASGSSITSTTMASPWIANVGSGTSYSAPMVAGAGALLEDRQSGLWPEAIKPILMATALHNIEGSTRLSEKDGAGGVDMLASFRVVDEGWYDQRSTISTNFPYSLYVYAYAGETVRAVIAWDSHVNGTYSSDTLDADIDLSVYSPSASYVTGSASVSNNFEIVEFTASTTGNYELRISRYDAGTSSEWVGAAWWPGHRVLSAYSQQTLGTPPISRDYFRFSASTLWNAVGIRSPSASNYNIYLYSGSAFGNPDDHDWLEDSTLSGTAVDFVVVDRNHAPSGNYFAEVRAVSGTGNYPTEWATHSADTVDMGTYGPYVMTSSDVLRVWDSQLTDTARKYFAVVPTSGNADLGMALMDSDPASSASWYQGRSQRKVEADSAGAGGAEYMNYLNPSDTDWMGLVVWNNGATTTTSFYLYTDTSAPTGSISINGGAVHTNSTSVTLNLSATDLQTGIKEMRFHNDGDPWSSWESNATSKVWTIPTGEGSKTVYVQYRNNAGMISSTYSDSIILDTTAPTGSLLVDGGAPYTNSINVTLSLSAADSGSGVDDMHLGNLGSTWEPWESYTTTHSWNLISGDGSKGVYVQYRDAAGNPSVQYHDNITLDTTAPTGSIAINGGAAYTNSTSATLTLSASDTLSGLDDMRFSNNGTSWSTWEAYAASKVWTLLSGDGTKTVYIQYRDNVGNVSSSLSDTIVLDTVASTGSISINGGASYTNSTSATLDLSASDAMIIDLLSGVDDMHFSNNGTSWSSWETYAASKVWTLLSGDGTKTVYVQYRDNAGNVSSSYTDTIMLDTINPSSSASSPSSKVTLHFTVTWSGTDATSGIDSYDVQYRVGSAGTWTNWLTGTTTTSDMFGPSSPVTVVQGQTYYFRVRARDNAGNLEAYPGGDGDTETFISFGLYLPLIMRD